MLRQAARDRGIPIYAIKNSTSSSLVRAFRTLMGVDPAAGNSFARAGGATGEGCRACAAAAWAAVDHPNVPALCVHRCQHALLAALRKCDLVPHKCDLASHKMQHLP